MHTVTTIEERAKHNGTAWGKIKSIFKKAVPQKKHTVIFWDNAVECPYRRYHKFNHHFMVAMQVGNTIADYDKRLSRAIGYLNAQDIKTAGIELTNQRQCLHNAIEEYSPSGMALAVMVHSIDGVVYESFQEDVLNEVLDELDRIGFTKLMMDETLDHVKKK